MLHLTFVSQCPVTIRQFSGWDFVGVDLESGARNATGETMESIRVDRWLCAARIYKSRTLASQACNSGKVKLNGKVARPADLVKVADQVRARAPRGDLVLLVVMLADKRLSPPKARELYQDETPEAAPPEPGVFIRDRGTGRPTKAERRRMQRVKGAY